MQWKQYPRTVLCVLLGIHVLAHVDRNMLLGFSPQITHDLGIGNAQYGFLVGAVWVLSFGFMATFMGTLADRYARPRVIAAGMAIWSVCTWASGYAQDFEQIVAARFLIASGEAALVPAAVSLLSDLFPLQRRATATGIFFMGIPLGMGISFLLAGTFGATWGWRTMFHFLGYAGTLVAIPLAFLHEQRGQSAVDATSQEEAAARGAPFLQQLRTVLSLVRATPPLLFTIAGFVLAHLVFASLAFAQIWLVNERGLDAAAMATRIGAVQLLCGTLGAVVGGSLGDRWAGRLKGGYAAFIGWLIVVCALPMLTYRLTPVGSPLFYLGMAAGAFMPMAAYGPACSLIQGLVPPSMRATIIGVAMMAINVFAISLGSIAIGAGRDALFAAGVDAPFTKILLAADLLAISAAILFAAAARRAPVSAAPANFIRSH